MPTPLMYSFAAVTTTGQGSLNTSTYTTIYTSIPSDAVSIIIMTTMDAPCMISLDSGTTAMIPMPKNTQDTLTQEFTIAPSDGQSTYRGLNVACLLLSSATTGSIYIGFRVRA